MSTLTGRIRRCGVVGSVPNVNRGVTTAVVSRVKRVSQFGSPGGLMTFTKISPDMFRSNGFATAEGQVAGEKSDELHRTLCVTIHYTVHSYHGDGADSRVVPQGGGLQRFCSGGHRRKGPFGMTMVTYMGGLLR